MIGEICHPDHICSFTVPLYPYLWRVISSSSKKLFTPFHAHLLCLPVAHLPWMTSTNLTSQPVNGRMGNVIPEFCTFGERSVNLRKLVKWLHWKHRTRNNIFKRAKTPSHASLLNTSWLKVCSCIQECLFMTWARSSHKIVIRNEEYIHGNII